MLLPPDQPIGDWDFEHVEPEIFYKGLASDGQLRGREQGGYGGDATDPLLLTCDSAARLHCWMSEEHPSSTRVTCMLQTASSRSLEHIADVGKVEFADAEVMPRVSRCRARALG